MPSHSIFSEFRPAIKFVMIFVAIYFTGNIIYGIWIEEWYPLPDPMTEFVSRQIAFILKGMNEPTSVFVSGTEPTVLIMKSESTVLRMYEGCNGINVMIVFAAFMVAFSGKLKNLLLFTTIGIVVIHISNLARIGLLYFTALYQPRLFYYFHKYLFTAVLYAVVFALWYVWTRYSIKIKNIAPASQEG